MRAVVAIGFVLIAFGIGGYAVLGQGLGLLMQYTGSNQSPCLSYGFTTLPNGTSVETSTTMSCTSSSSSGQATGMLGGLESFTADLIIWSLFVPGMFIVTGLGLILVGRRPR